MKKPVFTGAAVAIITPFKSTGEVDYEEFGKIIDHQIAHGTDAIVVCGTTGESATMSIREHHDAVAFCVAQVNHRVKVIAGAGSNDTAAALYLYHREKELDEYERLLFSDDGDDYDDDDDFQDDTVYEKIPAQPAADAPDAADAE